MTSANLEAIFAAIAGACGADGINRSEETIRRYGENTMPGGDRPPASVVYPASTADVQLIVRAANTYKVARSARARRRLPDRSWSTLAAK